jgi:hypothetical protein
LPNDTGLGTSTRYRLFAEIPLSDAQAVDIKLHEKKLSSMFRGDLKPFLYTKRLLCDTFSLKPLDTWRFAVIFAPWIR